MAAVGCDEEHSVAAAACAAIVIAHSGRASNGSLPLALLTTPSAAIAYEIKEVSL